MQRRPIIAGNWKMYKTTPQALELANGLKGELSGISNIDIVLCPAFTVLSHVSQAINSSNLKLGAQDMYWQDEGAFTGEVSPVMLKDLGCEFVIIGHSERRQFFAESNKSVNKKIKAALKHGLTPIVCVGENLSERQADKTFDVIRNHITEGLAELTTEDVLKITIAYEPVWAIGTGKTATPTQAQEAQAYIRKLLSRNFDSTTALRVRIQYGGSIKPDNIKELMMQPDIDGGLIGGASLKIDSFSQIIKNINEDAIYGTK